MPSDQAHGHCGVAGDDASRHAVRDVWCELQPLTLTRPAMDGQLYFRKIGFWDPVERSDGLFLEAGCAIDCDTLVNTFFEWHWQRAARCGARALVLDAEGEGEVHVDHVASCGKRKRIATGQIKGGRNVLPLPFLDGASGRLACSLGARGEGLLVRRGFWATDVAAHRHVAVCIVICTFNKVGVLAPALESLCRETIAMEAVTRVIVVDQGSDVLDEALGPIARAAQRGGKLDVLRQGNLGGSGGFARGIFEAMRDDCGPACSDILLMDDDVCFEPRLLTRLVALLQRVPADTMVGGSMLDMQRPHHLFAFSEWFDTRIGHVLRPQPHGLDMRCGESLDRLEGAKAGNYNGWFICSIPRRACEENGLPLPFFVRTDDCEYGMRLTSAGVPLTHMPGLFVWHDPFWHKPRAWIEYYTFRNHFILSVIASGTSPRRLILRRLSEFWHFLTTYQYSLALAICLGFEHYLEGPDHVFGDVQARHRAVLPTFSSFEAAQRDRLPGDIRRGPDCPAPGGATNSRFHPGLPGFVRVLANGWWTLLGHGSSRAGRHDSVTVLQAVTSSVLLWDAFHEYSFVIVDMPDGSSYLLRHDPKVARGLLRRMLRATALMLLRSTSLHAAYRRAAPRFGSLTNWRLTFDQSAA